MIVIDTHILIWWISNPEKLSQKAKKALEEAPKKGGIFISAISVWEIYMLVKKGRLELTMNIDTWFKKVLSLPFMRVVPIDAAIAASSVMLTGQIHDDPADRIIAATALKLEAPLVTSDTRLIRYLKIKTIW